MSKYDSILKEKKIYLDNDTPKKSKFGKIFLCDLFVILLCLVLSYIFYYNKILTSDNIFLNNFNYFKNIGNDIVKPLNFNFNSDGYIVNGDLTFDDKHYNYEVLHSDFSTKMVLFNQQKHLSYYLKDKGIYVMLDDVFNDQYIKINDYNIINSLNNLKKNYLSVISKDNYIKRFYVKDMVPVVEVNLSLNKELLMKLFDNDSLNDDIECIVTFKNNAISNKMIDGKLVIRNNSKNIRYVIEYSNDVIVIRDSDGKEFEFSYQKKGSDFTIKINKDGNLYSVFTGVKKEDSYVYSYQVINQIYNLVLDVSNLQDKIQYQFSSNVMKEGLSINKKASLVFSYNLSSSILEDVVSNISYNNLNQDKKSEIDNYIKEFFLPIREFIDEYKD